MEVTNIYTLSRRNVGDVLSSPFLYFSFPFRVEARDFIPFKGSFGHVVLGGGGLFWNEERILQIARQTRGHLISWGVGHNSKGRRKLRWPSYMDAFSLHGIRDWKSGYNWVPCASCMHSAFDRTYPITSEVILFEHRRIRTGLHNFPALRNVETDMDAVVAFLASGSVILTNSYHGAYWGTLLGRKVVIVRPFASRFYHLRHQPPISADDNWKTALKASRLFPESLSECRSANREHYERVREILTDLNR